jgi:DNA repair protein RadC
MMTALQDQPGEVFAILCVSTKLRVIAYHEVSRGTLDATLVHPREVFKAALLANAAAIILTHNHPSGDSIPSADDVQLTRRLVDAGALLGVEVSTTSSSVTVATTASRKAVGCRVGPIAHRVAPL